MSIIDLCKTVLDLLASAPNENLLLTPAPLLFYFNNADCNEHFLSTEQGIRYTRLVDSARKGGFSGSVATFLMQNAVLLSLMLVVYGDLQELLRDLVVYCRDPVMLQKLSTSKEALIMDCEDCVSQIYEGLHASDSRFDNLRDECEDLVVWYSKEYVDVIEKEENTRVTKVAGYLPQNQRQWCYLFSYVHNATEIFDAISGFISPRRRLVWKCTDGRRIDFETWRILSQSLPTEVKQCATLINDFKTAIYAPESRHVTAIYGPKEISHGVININFSTSVLVQQLVCLGMENWDEIWFKSRWPRHPELLKRLYYYRHVLGGRLDIKLPLTLFLVA